MFFKESTEMLGSTMVTGHMDIKPVSFFQAIDFENPLFKVQISFACDCIYCTEKSYSVFATLPFVVLLDT